MEGLKKAKWISLIIGIFLIIAGVVFYMNPLESLLSFTYFLAIMFLVIGILRIVRYFTDPMFKTGSFLVVGILDVLLGVAMIYTQPFSSLTLAMFLGFWELMSGVSEIVISIDLKQAKLPRWWLGVASGVLGIILGIMLIKDPALSSVLIGIYTIIYGITFISTFLHYQS